MNESYDKLREEYFRPWIASKRNQARSDCLWLGIIPIHYTRDEKAFQESLIDKGYLFSPMREHKIRLIFKIRLLEIIYSQFVFLSNWKSVIAETQFFSSRFWKQMTKIIWIGQKPMKCAGKTTLIYQIIQSCRSLHMAAQQEFPSKHLWVIIIEHIYVRQTLIRYFKIFEKSDHLVEPNR